MGGLAHPGNIATAPWCRHQTYTHFGIVVVCSVHVCPAQEGLRLGPEVLHSVIVIACRDTNITRHRRNAAVTAARLRAGRPKNCSLIPSRGKRFFHSITRPDLLYGCQKAFACGKAAGVDTI